MGYPEQSIDPGHLLAIAAIERLVGKVDYFPGLSERLADELRRKRLIGSTASLLRLEGRGVGVDDVERALVSAEQNSLDFGWCSDEIIAVCRTWNRLLESTEQTGREHSIAIDVTALSAVHASLFRGVPVLGQEAGQLRSEDYVVRAYDEEGEVVGDVFEAPAPSELAELLEATLAGMRDELAGGRQHPVLLVAWLLARLLSMQPFGVGSIRAAHVFCDVILEDLGYRHLQLRSLEEIMVEDAGNYFVRLRKYRQSIGSGEEGLAAWQAFFLSCLERQATELEQALENACDEDAMSPLAEQLLELARARGQLTVRESTEATDANRNVLKMHLSKLVQRGLLRRKGVGKGVWYEPV